MNLENKVKKLGKILHQERKKQKLSQEQLAALSGVGVRFIRELEHGKESCHLGKSLWIAHMLGVKIQVDGEEL